VRGTLGDVSTLQYGVITEQRDLTCDLYTFFSWTKTCNKADQTSLKTEYNKCVGKSSCTFNVYDSFFDYSASGCTTTSSATKGYYISAICQGIDLTLPNGMVIDRKTVSYILGGFDGLLSLIFGIMIFL
jgi:hypothetical protein